MAVDSLAAGSSDAGGDTLFIAGITPFSTVDWPGKLACVAFLAGCPWRCPYCQNVTLQTRSSATAGLSELLSFIDGRRGLLDAVVFSGGEPLAQEAVVHAAQRVREMGFAVGLHTCGAYPERLERMLAYTDWVGLDIKAPWDLYEQTTGVAQTAELVRASLNCVLASGVEMEARTTWHPDLLSAADIERIGHELAQRGVRHWAIQAYRHHGTNASLSNQTVYSSQVPEGLDALFEHFEFRGA